MAAPVADVGAVSLIELDLVVGARPWLGDRPAAHALEHRAVLEEDSIEGLLEVHGYAGRYGVDGQVKWMPHVESNHDSEIQSLASYH